MKPCPQRLLRLRVPSARVGSHACWQFACFPECAYAVITLPHTTPEFSLVNAFTQVEPLPSSSFGHILYVFHRDALGGARALAVRPASVIDSKAVMPLIETLSSEAAAVKAAFEAATGPIAEGESRTKAAYVAECLGHPVGLALLDDQTDVAGLQAQYALEDVRAAPLRRSGSLVLVRAARCH